MTFHPTDDQAATYAASPNQETAELATCPSSGRLGNSDDWKLGLWKTNDGLSAAVVFVDTNQVVKGFLLANWRGRPGYTRIPVAELTDCSFVAKVFIARSDYGIFCPGNSIVGQLNIEQGCPKVTTIDEHGSMTSIAIAPLADE